VQVDPAVAGHVEHGLRQDLAVGDDRRAVDLQGFETLDESFAARAVGDDLDTGLLGTLTHRARDELSSAPCPCVSTRQHGDDLVPRPDEGLQGRDSYGRGPGEEQTHDPSLRGATAGV
jgi:hypothetical protein